HQSAVPLRGHLNDHGRPPRAPVRDPREGAMRRRTSLLLLLTLVALLLAPSPAGAGPENPGADEARFVQLINAERAKKGIAPLQVDGQLTAASRSWAAHQLGGGCGADKNICHASSLSTGVSADWVK